MLFPFFLYVYQICSYFTLQQIQTEALHAGSTWFVFYLWRLWEGQAILLMLQIAIFIDRIWVRYRQSFHTSGKLNFLQSQGFWRRIMKQCMSVENKLKWSVWEFCAFDKGWHFTISWFWVSNFSLKLKKVSRKQGIHMYGAGVDLKIGFFEMPEQMLCLTSI